jgi:hypothetical protein
LKAAISKLTKARKQIKSDASLRAVAETPIPQQEMLYMMQDNVG